MSLEEFTPDLDSSEGSQQSAEAPKEVSEKLKESIKRSTAGIKRTKKDEKKAKKHDLLLAGFLVKIIIDKKYDSILDSLFKALDSGFSSNIILGILSLIKVEISDKIRDNSTKGKIVFNYHSQELINFDDNNIQDEIKVRINEWIEDIIDSTTLDASSVKTQELLSAFINVDNISTFMSIVFSHFMNSLNISIASNKAKNISTFILQEIEKEVKKINIEHV